jgi:hypothetical protein
MQPGRLRYIAVKPSAQFQFGHLDDYESYNPRVLGFVKNYSAWMANKSAPT